MYSNPVINSISEITSYKQFAMDMLVSEYLQKKMDESLQSAKSLTIEKTKDPITNPITNPITDPYQSPKRDLMCSQCGQDSRWCVCHLNI
tara:strand:+ start:560 stop:829 length:270 start_codon:yes stop_codon:yes gene_type:complete